MLVFAGYELKGVNVSSHTSGLRLFGSSSLVKGPYVPPCSNFLQVSPSTLFKSKL